MDRAYSLLDIKSISDDERVIEGVASTPTADRMGDIVDPLGAKFSLPMPLLWQHNSSQPIGHVEFAKPTKTGIPFKARLANPDDFESEAVKERLREAWDSIKNKLVRAVSIGFRSIEHSFMDNGGIKFSQWEWLELSAVTIPANAGATINTIKSYDAQARIAAGVDDQSESEGSAASGRETASADTSRGHVVRLADPARVRASPFVIKRIIHTR